MEKQNRIFEIARLIAREKTDILSAEEKEVLQNWIAENEANRKLYNDLQNVENLINELNELKNFDVIKAFQKVEQIISKERKQLNIFRFAPNYMKYAAAIAALVLCTYLILSEINKVRTDQIAQSTIVPGEQKAILITADNRKIELGSSDEKQIIKDELADIVKSGSTLSYNKIDSIDNPINVTEYHTLITPRGGEYTLVLSDGTEVTLNSGSKLKYPVVFNNNSREVALEGEAFFKVTKSRKTPFIVKADNINVTVYGTVFNVSAYNNESIVQTTLIEGSIGVSINSRIESEAKVKPGQQHIYNKDNGNTETKEVNTEQFIAWTRGMFVFQDEPIENILKAMSRWYNFDYEFKDESLKKQRFTLSLGKYDNVSKILDMISLSSNVKFSTNGNSIIVYAE
jgi:ferric-dicitrate binding protein FerR (iron transport regulator)